MKVYSMLIILWLVMINCATGLEWRNCTDTALQAANAQCAFVSVPLNYKRPHGNKLRIGVSRILHTSSEANYRGAILVARIGLSSAGLSQSMFSKSVPSNISSTYDWIGFDPRGTGPSGTAMSCISDYFPDIPINPIPTTQEIENRRVNRSKQYAEACHKKYGSSMPHYNTINRARDMELIRKAIGVEKIHIYASSYGTYLAQVYATLYPKRVGKMVLESPIDSRKFAYQWILNVYSGTQRAIDLWFQWVAKYDNIYHLGNRSCEVEAHWTKSVKGIENNPVNGIIGPLEWNDIFILIAYAPQNWPLFAEILSNYAIKNNNTLLSAQYEIGTDEGWAVNLITSCNDGGWPRQWDRFRTDIWRMFSIAPVETWSEAWYTAPCVFWPYQTSSRSNVNGSLVGDILLVFGTNNVGYREEGAMDVRRRFPRSRFLRVTDGIRMSNGFIQNTCVDNIIIKYLSDGTLPARQSGDVADFVCPASPLPVPSTGR